MAYRRNSNTAWRKIAEEAIVVHLDAKEFFGLNDTAADVWNALDGTIDLGGLAARFGIDHEDVATFCAELQKLGLVVLVEVGEAPSKVSPESEKPHSRKPQTEGVDPPRILWREEIRLVAASCGFTPGLNPTCNQVPFS